MASVSTPGVFVTRMPRAVAAATSMLSTPTAMFEITRRRGPAASMTAPSMVSVSRHRMRVSPGDSAQEWLPLQGPVLVAAGHGEGFLDQREPGLRDTPREEQARFALPSARGLRGAGRRLR